MKKFQHFLAHHLSWGSFGKSLPDNLVSSEQRRAEKWRAKLRGRHWTQSSQSLQAAAIGDGESLPTLLSPSSLSLWFVCLVFDKSLLFFLLILSISGFDLLKEYDLFFLIQRTFQENKQQRQLEYVVAHMAHSSHSKDHPLLCLYQAT